jgi:hypothetical protein
MCIRKKTAELTARSDLAARVPAAHGVLRFLAAPRCLRDSNRRVLDALHVYVDLQLTGSNGLHRLLSGITFQ